MAARLKELYKSEVRKSLQDKFGYKNSMEVPKLTKIVVNMGVGEASQDSKAIEGAVVRYDQPSPVRSRL